MPAYARPVWIASSLLSGLLVAVATSVRARACPPRRRRADAAGGVGLALGWLAVGCPTCNQLVVGFLGVSGALSYFAPVQPWLAGASLALLIGALAWRLRALARASIPSGRPPAPAKVADR